MNLPTLPVFPSRPDCRSCDRWEAVPRNPGVPFSAWGEPGPGRPVVVAVGAVPGFHEHNLNDSFRGKVGALLRDVILHDLSNSCTIYLGYMVRCGPEQDAKARHYKSCHGHLAEDLASILAAHPSDPIHVLLLGAKSSVEFHRLFLGMRLTHKECISSNGRVRTVLGRQIHVFSTLHPAEILRNNSLIYSVEDHVELLSSTIRGNAPVPTDPSIEAARAPLPSDPRTVSLDIETYGITRFSASGRLLPDQTVFHPARSLDADGCPLRDLVQTVSVTVARDDSSLEQLAPGPTFVFEMHRPAHRRHLARWLGHARTVLGMNLQFDLLYLRSQPDLRFHLEDQDLVDLSVLNYLHSELRPERSLKALGPVLGTHAYPKEQLDREKRYHDAKSPELHRYNAADTHNTLLACAELARRIRADYPSTSKLSPGCLAHYSDTVWTVVRMSEAGVPMDRHGLAVAERQVVSRMQEIAASASALGLMVEGKGSASSKLELMKRACVWIEENHDPSVRSHPLFELTEAKREISINDSNRQLFLSYPLPSELAEPLRLLGEHSRLQKLLSSYFFPLLRHQRKDPSNRSSRLVARPSSPIGISYPTWFVTPTASKDGSGAEGGTLQGRITCKNFRHQTDPDEIKAHYRSRWPHGHVVGYDLSQIEMVVAGLLSGDDALCSAFCADPPLDLHTSRAVQVFGPQILEHPDFKKVYRQAAKGANFGDLFRAGAATLQAQVFRMTGVVVPMSICENIVKTRSSARPGLWAWQENLIRETRARGYVELPFIGQSRRFMGGDAYDVSEIVNMPIQCTAGNVLLRIQHRLHRTLPSINAPAPDVLMFLNVYDAIYFDCRSDAAVERLDSLFRDAFTYVTTEGYWARLCAHHSRTIPIRYERTIYT